MLGSRSLTSCAWLALTLTLLSCNDARPTQRPNNPAPVRSAVLPVEGPSSVQPAAAVPSAPGADRSPSALPHAVPPASEESSDVAALIAARPYLSEAPPGPAPKKGFPLVLYLHGYGASNTAFLRLLGIEPFARDAGFVYAVPNGTPDHNHARFWNATDSCCNFDKEPVDDVRYLGAVLDDVQRRHRIDASRIFVVGFSNGGFMAHRLACELADRVAAIVSIAGATWNDPSKCQPRAPVAVLQIHGDADTAVRYDGGRTLNRKDSAMHPSAQRTVEMWAALNHCARAASSSGTLDLEPKLEGAETSVAKHRDCRGGAAELWTVRGGTHFIGQGRQASDAIWRFLAAHPKR